MLVRVCRAALFNWKPLLQAARALTLPTMADNKLDCPEFHKILTPELLNLESIFTTNGYGFRLVGGVVRDLLLGNAPKDIDIATDCTPDAMIQLFDHNNIKYIPTGLQHGTLTVHTNSGTDYEVTTLRVDRVTDGRHAVVDFTKDWRLDAERRDLTINAMAVTLDGRLYDYFNGLQHLEEKRVLFVGDATKRIQEDYLRILRYFRFYGRIVPTADSHDGPTLEAIRSNAEGLKGISVERIWSEIKRILTGNHAPHLVTLMYQLGVAECIGLPKNGNIDELSRAWHCIRGHTHSLPPETLLMSLVGTVGQSHDLTHAWKLSNNEKRLGAFVVQHRDKALGPDATLKTFQDLIIDGAFAPNVVELLYYCDKVELAKQISHWEVPRLPVNGSDLKAAGFKPGTQMGSILRALKTKWKESYYTLNSQELIEHAHKMVAKQQEAEESRTKS